MDSSESIFQGKGHITPLELSMKFKEVGDNKRNLVCMCDQRAVPGVERVIHTKKSSELSTRAALSTPM